MVAAPETTRHASIAPASTSDRDTAMAQTLDTAPRRHPFARRPATSGTDATYQYSNTLLLSHMRGARRNRFGAMNRIRNGR